MCMKGERPGCVRGLGSLDVNAVPALYSVAIVVAGLILDSFLVFKMSRSNAGSTGDFRWRHVVGGSRETSS